MLRSSKRLLEKAETSKDENRNNYDDVDPTSSYSNREATSTNPRRKRDKTEVINTIQTITLLEQHVNLYEKTHTIILGEK